MAACTKHPLDDRAFPGGSRAQPKYRIAPAVRASVDEERIVILDTNAGKFYVCTGRKAEFWRRLSAGEMADEIATRTASTRECLETVRTDFEAFKEELIARRLLLTAQYAPRPGALRLLLRAAAELIGFDVRMKTLGFKHVYSSVRSLSCADVIAEPDLTSRAIRAIATVAKFHYRPVRCLQRAVAATRLLRSLGIPAELVIGYRSKPFISHAWVEVGGQVVTDSPKVAEQLTVLDRM